MILENDPDETLDESSAPSASADMHMKIHKKSAMVIIKAVTGRIPAREELVKMLKDKFKAQSKSLTALTATQILEVTARRLISLKYVSLKSGISSGDIRNTDITVHKEIHLAETSFIGHLNLQLLDFPNYSMEQPCSEWLCNL